MTQSAYVSVRADDTLHLRLSVDDLDRLRGFLLAERAVRVGRVAEHEAMLFGAPGDAFGAELRAFARASLARDRASVDDVDEMLERLVESYGSCEWCDTAIPRGQLKAIPRGRLCAACRRRGA
jgi:RNA polymerase-binding transcription factor DksA